jgi:hypothetical protein
MHIHYICECRVRKRVCVCDCAGALAPVREPADQPRHTHAVPDSGPQRGQPVALAAAQGLTYPIPSCPNSGPPPPRKAEVPPEAEVPPVPAGC